MNINHGNISLKNAPELSRNLKYPVSVTANSTVNIRKGNLNLQNNIILTEATAANASIAAARATAKAASIATSSITNDRNYLSNEDPLDKSVTFQISTLCTIQRSKYGESDRSSLQPKIINSVSPIKSLDFNDNLKSLNHKIHSNTDKSTNHEIYTDTVKSLNYKMYTNKEIENVNVSSKPYSNKGTKFEKLRRELESLEQARDVPFSNDTNDFKSSRYSDNSVYSNQSTLSSCQSDQPRHHSVLSEPLSYLSDCSSATSYDIKSGKSSFQRNSFLNTDNESSENSYNMKKYRISDLKRHSRTSNSFHLDVAPTGNLINITDLSNVDKNIQSMQYMSTGPRNTNIKSATLNGNLEMLLSNSSLFPETDIDSGTVSENYFFPQTHLSSDQPIFSFEKTRSLVDLRKDTDENYKHDISKAISTENLKKSNPNEECNLIKRLKSRAQSTQELRIADSLTKLNVPEWMNDFKLSHTHKTDLAPRTPLSGPVTMSFKNLKHHDSILSKYKYASLPLNKSINLNKTPVSNKVLLPSSLYRSKSQNLVFFNPKEESKIKIIKEETNKPIIHSSSLKLLSDSEPKGNIESNKLYSNNFTDLRLYSSHKEPVSSSSKLSEREIYLDNYEDKEKTVQSDNVKSKVNFYKAQPTQKFTNSISHNQNNANKIENKINFVQPEHPEKSNIQLRPTYRTEQIISIPDPSSKREVCSTNPDEKEKGILQEKLDKETLKSKPFVDRNERYTTLTTNTFVQNEICLKNPEEKVKYFSNEKGDRDFSGQQNDLNPVEGIKSISNKKEIYLSNFINKEKVDQNDKMNKNLTDLQGKFEKAEELSKTPTTNLSGEMYLKNSNDKGKSVQVDIGRKKDSDVIYLSDKTEDPLKNSSNTHQKELDPSTNETREKITQQDKKESTFILDLLIGFTQNQISFDDKLCESFGINPNTLKLLLNVKRKTPNLNREEIFIGSASNENSRIENKILKNENNNNYVTCNLKGCEKEILQPNKIDRGNCSCYNCYTYYCSKKCRNADFPNHVGTCSFRRIQHMLVKVKNSFSVSQLQNLSRYAQENYSKYGEGAILVAFESSRSADDFVNGQLNRLVCQPYYISRKEVKKKIPSFKIDFYDAFKEYIVTLIICASLPSNSSNYSAPTFKLSFKLKFSNKISSSDKNEVVGTSFPQKQKITSKDLEVRKKFFDYVVHFFKSRNVNLNQSHLLLYNKLEKYLNEGVQFEPVKIFIKDPVKNSTVACVISPNKEVVTTAIRNVLNKSNSNISNDINTTNKTITETEI